MSSLASSSRAVEVQRLMKYYGTQLVVRNFSISIAAGERVALLGPNGAGKTTILRILATLLRPDSGVVRVFGWPVSDNGHEVRQLIGYVAHHSLFYSQLTAAENITLSAALHALPWSKDETERVLQSVGLTAAAHRRVALFSRGMVQRLALARALLSQPRLLLLDEPESGLDPLALNRFEQVLVDVVEKSKATVLFTSHRIEQAQRLSDRVLVIVGGRLVFDNPSQETSVDTIESAYESGYHGNVRTH